MRYHRFIFIFIFFFIPLSIFSQNKVALWKKKEFNIGVYQFSINLSEKDQQYYLSYKLPLYFWSTLGNMKVKYISDQSKYHWANWLYQRKKDDIMKNLRTLRLDKDKKYVQDAKVWSVSPRKNQSDEKKNLNELNQLEKTAVEDLIIPDKIIINWKKLNGEQAPLGNIQIAKDLSAQMNRDSLDAAIWGEINLIQDRIFIKIYYQEIWMPEARILETSEKESELIVNIISQVRPIFRSILGKEYAEVRISVEPKDSLIYVNNQLKGIGEWIDYYYPEGVHNIKIQRRYYYSDSFYLNINKKNNQVIVNKRLRSFTDRGFFLINSFPQGADIYFNNIWQGKTPFWLYNPINLSLLRLELPGYAKYQDMVGGSIQTDLDIQLEVFKKEASLDTLRTRFFLSFTFFGFSLGTFIALATWNSQLKLALSSPIGDPVNRLGVPTGKITQSMYQQIQANYTTVNALSWTVGSLFAGFSIWMLVELFYYYLPKVAKESGSA